MSIMNNTDSKRIRIAFLGDLYLGSRRVTLENELMSLLRGCDHVVVNLEGPICEPSLDHLPKAPILRSDPGIESVLKDWHITCATLANNHIFDYGCEAFEDTCSMLKRKRIAYVGAGHNMREATTPVIIEISIFSLKIF